MKKISRGFIILLLSIVTMTGCASVDVEVNPDVKVRVSVNKNQTVDVEMDMLLDRIAFDIFNRTEATLEEMVATLREEGFKAEIVETDNRIGISASIRIDNRDGAHASDLTFELDDLVEVRDYIIVSDYVIDQRFNLRDIVLASGLVEDRSLVQTFLEQASIELTVKLPIRPVEHNGDREDNGGKEISWDIDPIEENHLQLRVTVPNVEKIGWFLGLSLISFIVLVIVIRKILISIKNRKA